MSEERKGVFTPQQEELLDKLYVAKGITEAMDGVAIKMIDNVIIEKLKAKIPVEFLPTVYEIIDEIMNGLATTIIE